MRESRGTKIGKRIGSVLGASANVVIGYQWAKHGIIFALEIYGAFVVACLAVLGAVNLGDSSRASGTDAS